MHDEIRKCLVSCGPQGVDAEFSNQESLLEAGVIDSMAMVDLIEHLEERFGINISEDDMTPEHFDSVDSIAAFVGSLVGNS